MINGANNEQYEVFDIVKVIKISSILFCIIALITNININSNDFFSDLQQINIKLILFLIIATCFIYYLTYISFYKKPRNIEFYHKFLERILYNSLFIISIILSGASQSEYKFLFLFLIIIISLQDGMIQGIIYSILSVATLLSIHLLWGHSHFEKRFLEEYIILFVVFIIIAWIIGVFVKKTDKKLDELVLLVDKDTLTGVYNLNYLTQKLNEVEEYNQQAGMILLDIDYFKEYNDLYGRMQGDYVLKAMGVLLRECTMDIQYPVRVDGATFGILLPNENLKRTIQLSESIRKCINDEYFKGEENQPNGRITVSIGVSHYPDKVDKPNLLLDSSKAALNNAKHINRNSIQIYDDIYSIIKTEKKSYMEHIREIIFKTNEKDKITRSHSDRVVVYARAISEQLNLSQYDTELLIYAAYMHDIGKYNISTNILMKGKKLTEEEWKEIRKHPKYSAEIIKYSVYGKYIKPIVLHHHEKYDGTGYPERLKGDEIPYLSRVLTVIDAFDAMTSYRPYSIIKTYDEAIEELKLCSGKQFDPEIVDAFIESIKNI